VHCTGVMCIPVHDGVKSVSWFKGEHECGWEVPQLLLGEPNSRPTLELVQPSQCSGGLISPQERHLIVEMLEVAGIWSKVIGRGIRQREYAKTLADNSFVILVLTKAMKLYVQHLQERYPSLIHIKYGALRTFPHEKSQYSRHGHELHSNYTVDCKDLPPSQWLISIIVALDNFQFFYLPTKFVTRGDIVRTTIYPGQMIMITNNCLHSGGPNKMDKMVYHLFAYLVSQPSDIPQNGVSKYTFSKTVNSNNAVITDVFNGLESAKLKRQSREPAYISRFSRQTVLCPEFLLEENGKRGLGP
jgi:hypothetical protein